WRKTFEGRYDNLLSLLEIEVQPAALSTLTQYYDPPFRCFTFRDFQLALTLKEYKRLLGLPLVKSPSYLSKGHYPSWALVAKLLKTSELKMLKRKRNKNGLEGLSRASIEERLHQSSRGKEIGRLSWTVLFSQIEDNIDLVVINAFLAKRDRGENLVIAVLANTYYTLNYCHEKNKKGLRCCTSLLYLWMTTHFSTIRGR
ncbi:hypothetical protein CR513_03593, partial [Mucuna pruriens]